MSMLPSMNKYQKSDNVVSMATDYASMMKRYSEFSQKVDAIDENSLSSEDLAYYTEAHDSMHAEARIGGPVIRLAYRGNGFPRKGR